MMRSLSAVFALSFFLPVYLFAQADYSAPDLEWRTIETKHFTVSYHEGSERTARVVAKIAEEIHGPITALYNHIPDTKVHFVIKDISDYSNGAAYFFNNKIEIWASPLDFDLRGTHNWLRNVIAHEYTHIIQIQAAMKWGRSVPAFTLQWFGYERERRTDVLYGFPNTLVSYPLPGVIVPPWMAEGTAQYMRNEFGYENWDAHRDMILRCYALSDSMLTWAEMGAFGKTSLGNESVYNAGYNLTRYIAKTYGEQAVVDITKAMSKPFIFTIDAAIKDVLGIAGKQLYDEWASALKDEYRTRIAPVKAKNVFGERVASVGFGNFHPVFTPDRSKISYISNKTSDFLGQSALFLYDRKSGTEEMIAGGVRSQHAWTKDGKRVIYSKYNPPSVYGHLYYDLYAMDIETKDETRLTHGQRAYNPALSPDGMKIVFLFAKDGNVNIGVVSVDGKDFRQVTNFVNGEQAFSPQWFPDGSHIVFGYSSKVQRSIARIAPAGGEMKLLVSSPEHDARDPRYSSDGKWLYFSSNRNGIFNIYRLDVERGEEEQLTNVIGGAFMPSVDDSGTVVYSEYTATGYKIALLKDAQPLDVDGHHYLPVKQYAPQIASASQQDFDWESLRSFDDTIVPEYGTRSYKTIFQSMMFFPVLRIDGYNPDNKGLSLLKPGLMMYSSDILNRLEMLASGSINIDLERDLYLNVTYRDKLPLLGTLGIFPDLSLEVFNVTRGTSSSIDFPLDTVDVDVDFNLLEFAVRLKHNLFSSHTRMELSYRHSRYTSTIGSFTNPETFQLNPAFDNLYLIGNDLGLWIHHHDVMPARDAEINPVGWRMNLHYNYEFNRFNPNGDFEIDFSSGLLVPKYQDFNFHRLEGNAFVSFRLPGWLHTLSLRARAASVLGPTVEDFFNFYAGGIAGMQGYTYYALGGNELYHFNLTYRFPIVPSMDLRIGHLLFDKLYASIFYDAGDAAARPDYLRIDNRKEDVGFELRLESFSFAMYPTRIFFSGAYGLTEFASDFSSDVLRREVVHYGKEWRWYFGVLFGFDLSEGGSER